MTKLNSEPFPGMHEDLKKTGYKDPTLQAMTGIASDEATVASENANWEAVPSPTFKGSVTLRGDNIQRPQVRSNPEQSLPPHAS